jgi:DNA polymerase III gamma/tau subunit
MVFGFKSGLSSLVNSVVMPMDGGAPAVAAALNNKSHKNMKKKKKRKQQEQEEEEATEPASSHHRVLKFKLLHAENDALKAPDGERKKLRKKRGEALQVEKDCLSALPHEKKKKVKEKKCEQEDDHFTDAIAVAVTSQSVLVDAENGSVSVPHRDKKRRKENSHTPPPPPPLPPSTPLSSQDSPPHTAAETGGAGDGAATSSRYTVSIAVAGSIIDNAQSFALATRLAGQIARAAAIFTVDECGRQ